MTFVLWESIYSAFSSTRHRHRTHSFNIPRSWYFFRCKDSWLILQVQKIKILYLTRYGDRKQSMENRTYLGSSAKHLGFYLVRHYIYWKYRRKSKHLKRHQEETNDSKVSEVNINHKSKKYKYQKIGPNKGERIIS